MTSYHLSRQRDDLNKKYISILFSSFLLFGCHASEKNDSMRIIKSETISADIKIPKVVFENIITEIKSESISADPVYLFHPLEVIFESEMQGTLSEDTHFIFSNGGGAVDLKNLIKKQGSFYFYFPKQQFEKTPNLDHIYFISEFPKKKIENENFGIGCGQWVDLKSQFSVLKVKQTKLNTTDQRYLYVAAGYYIFVFRKSNQVYLTHLHLTDSNYINLKCPDQTDLQGELTYEHK